MMYDITQEYFSGRVYPGDPRPVCKRLKSFDAGDLSTVSEVTMQVHAATHIDAPIHRVRGGKGIAELPLSKCVGDCAVLEDAEALAQTNAARVLIKCGQIDAETARLAVQKGVQFLGVEGQSVGDRAVHSILLENEVVVLEGAVLSHVPAGEYFLFAAPVPFGGCDGAPCRAVLWTKE